MSDKIRPNEVSEILFQQLQQISDGQDFDEIGTVLTVSDGVARVYGLRNAEANELLEFENGTMAIVMNLEEDNVGCVLLGPTSEIKEGQVVKRTHRIASIRVNDNMLGRVINPLGEAIDGLGEIDLSNAFEMPLDRKAPGVIFRQPVKEPLQTGLKGVDSMIPIGRGQRELIIGDRQTGKTAIALDTIINQKSFHWPEGLYGGYFGANAERTWCVRLHHHRVCNSSRPCCHAILRAIRWCSHRRILPRPWRTRASCLRRPFQASRGLS